MGGEALEVSGVQLRTSKFELQTAVAGFAGIRSSTRKVVDEDDHPCSKFEV
jgi:hypothetical protein